MNADPMFISSAADRADLSTSGRKPPLLQPTAQVRRIRVVLWDDGQVEPIPLGIGYPFAVIDGQRALGSTIIELTEGVFDAEWKR